MINSSFMNNNNEFIEIHENTLYWTYHIQNIFWNKLNANFNRKLFYISSYKKYPIKKNDIVLIYNTHTTKNKSGFICACQVDESMTNNNKSIHIFDDKNMNKFYVPLSKIFITNESVKLSQIHKKINTFNIQSFRSKYISNNTVLTKIPTCVGNDLLSIFIDNLDPTSIDSNDESSVLSVNSQESICSNATECSDDAEIRIGHVPILFEPCFDFCWNKNSSLLIKEFKKHYFTCRKCITTNNNNTIFSKYLNSAEIMCCEIKDIHKVNKLLTYYYDSKQYQIELIDDDKKYDHIIIHTINNRSHVYHKCILILW